MQHTLGHIDCPACQQKAYSLNARLDPNLLFSEASVKWIESRKLPSSSLRARFVSDRSIHDFVQFRKALMRFFYKLPLNKITMGHIRQYQEDRAMGLLGPTRDEMFPRLVKALARKLRVSVEEVQTNKGMLAIVNARIDAKEPREVGPDKINKELAMLIRILRRAGLWSDDSDEEYEKLQVRESGIPKALTPEEQEKFIEVALQMHEWIGCYAILGIHCTLSTKEERRLQIGDINLKTGMLQVRTAKNKYRPRTIPLTESAQWAAERLIERANLLGSVQPQHHLFPFRPHRNTYDPGKPMSQSGVKKPWDEIRHAAGLPWFTPYGLRHTGCTRYAEDGCSIHNLLAIAGHMTRRTQQHYISISDQAKRRMVQQTHGTSLHTVKIAVRSEQAGYLGIHPGKKTG